MSLGGSDLWLLHVCDAYNSAKGIGVAMYHMVCREVTAHFKAWHNN